VIRGRVIDTDSHLPIAGVLLTDIWYVPVNFNEAPPIPVKHNTHSDADGNYAVYAPARRPVRLEASGAPHVSTCAGDSTCVGWVTDVNTQMGDIFTVNVLLQLGGTFSGTLRDVAGRSAGATLSIYDSNGNWLYYLGDQRTYVSINGTYRSPPLPAGTYYAMAHPDGVNDWWSGACQVYAGRNCPNTFAGQRVLDTAPTPIEIVNGEDRGGVDFTLILDDLFTSGFEPYF